MQVVKLSRVEELILRGTTYGLTVDENGEGLGLSREAVGHEIADAYSKLHRLARVQCSNGYLPDPTCMSPPVIRM